MCPLCGGPGFPVMVVWLRLNDQGVRPVRWRIQRAMQWGTFLKTLARADRARLIRCLEEGQLYSGLAAQAKDPADVEWMVACIDRSLDALAAARILLEAPAEPPPWEHQAYRAYRSLHPATKIRMTPAQLTALRAAAQRRSTAAAVGPVQQAARPAVVPAEPTTWAGAGVGTPITPAPPAPTPGDGARSVSHAVANA